MDDRTREAVERRDAERKAAQDRLAADAAQRAAQADERKDKWFADFVVAPPSHLSDRSKALWKTCNPVHIRSDKRLALLQIALESLDRAAAAR